MVIDTLEEDKMKTGYARAKLLFLGMTFSMSVLFCGLADCADPAQPRVVSLLADFEKETPGPIRSGWLEPWYWSKELKQKAKEFSAYEIVADTGFGKQCLKITLSKNIPWEKKGRPIDCYCMTKAFRMPDYLPPEVDALRMRVKVLEGSFTFAVGGPTIYFGNSDVKTAPQTMTSDQKEWRILEFNLNRDLTRNNRRAGFTRGAPVIHYTRWIQEPLFLYVYKQSHGKILFDQVELVTYGQGKPYPSFKPESIKTLVVANSFDQADDMKKVFTNFIQGDTRQPTGEPKLFRETWGPAKLSRITEDGRQALEIRYRFTEEVCFSGIHAHAPENANAVRIVLKAEHKKVESISLDFIAYVAPEAKFPWEKLAPPENWQGQPEIAFNYYLCKDNVNGLALGYYHSRRAIPNNKWTTLVIPFADFVCAYGREGSEANFKKQLPLLAKEIAGVALLSSFRQHAAETRIVIDEISFVSVPDEKESLRSFWQPAGK